MALESAPNPDNEERIANISGASLPQQMLWEAQAWLRTQTQADDPDFPLQTLACYYARQEMRSQDLQSEWIARSALTKRFPKGANFATLQDDDLPGLN